MKKMIYAINETCGDSEYVGFAYSIVEAHELAHAFVQHLTEGEKAKTTVAIEGYMVEDKEGESAKNAFCRFSDEKLEGLGYLPDPDFYLDMTDFSSVIKALVENSHMTQAAFAYKFNIPLRTVEDWCAGRREPAAYIIKMIERSLFVDESKEVFGSDVSALQIVKALDKIVYEVGDFFIDTAIENNFLTINEARNGRAVLWYMDETEKECCVYLDDGSILSKEEIEEQLL